MKNAVNLILGLCALSACSHEVDLTYNCVPSGAKVYEEGIGTVGTCPVVLKYSPYDVKISDGKLYTDKIRVVWVSGASVMVAPMALDIPPDHQISLTFLRPQDSLDSEKDERFSIAYEESLPAPEEKYIVSPGQDKDLFDAFNSSFTCAFDGLIQDVYSQCP